VTARGYSGSRDASDVPPPGEPLKTGGWFRHDLDALKRRYLDCWEGDPPNNPRFGCLPRDIFDFLGFDVANLLAEVERLRSQVDEAGRTIGKLVASGAHLEVVNEDLTVERDQLEARVNAASGLLADWLQWVAEPTEDTEGPRRALECLTTPHAPDAEPAPAPADPSEQP
jgi:hypothetical protein